MMMDRPNRTFISSVLFLDIVGYSKQPVTEQIRLKEQFNTLVTHLISDIPESDRIVLDTGDGAALSFLGDPEDALFVAVKLRDAIKEKQEAEFPDLHLRMGINLGPVKLLKDINGRPNLIGDGINVAQRVMNFAEPDQILVSRSFYDVVSCLSDEYRDLFSHQGLHTDKHVREHELYEIGFVDPDRSVTINQRMQVLETRSRLPQEQLSQLEKALEPHVGDHAHVLVQAKAMSAYDFATLRNALATYIADPVARESFSRIQPQTTPAKPERKPWLIPAALAAVAVLGAALWWVMRPAPPAADQAAGNALADKSASEQSVPGKAEADSGQAKGTDPAATASALPPSGAAPATVPPTDPAKGATPPAKSDDKAAKVEKKAARDAKGAKGAPAPVTPVAPATPAASAAQEAPSASAQARTRNAMLRFQISGLAEIWVDGVRVGPSGSVLQYAVTPGEHRIQIRDCGFPPDTKNQSVSVEANNSKLIVASC